MLLGIDHLVLACRDPDAGVELIRREVGLAPGGGGRHERHGTFNRLVWLADAYLELMGVFDPGLARNRGIGARTLAMLEAGHEGVASFAVASDDIAADVAILRGAGSPYEEPGAGERLRADGEVIRWQTSLPASPAGDGLPFLIEHELTGSEWGEAARRARAQFLHPFGGTARLIRLELAVADPEALADRYQTGLRISGLRLSGGSVDLPIGAHVVRLVPAAGQTPAATIVIEATAGMSRSIELIGCRFQIEVGAIA